MFLAIDIGNSQTTLAVFHQDQLLFSYRIETKASRTEDELYVLISVLLKNSGYSPLDIHFIGIASVVPSVDVSVARFCEKYFKAEYFFVDTAIQLPFRVQVDFPKEVGADRLANAAFAAQLDHSSLIVDVGTATTFDVVIKDSSGQFSYEGGAILPGVRLSLESLSNKTAKLPLVGQSVPTRVIGKNTVDCIQAGVLWGYFFALKGLIEKTQKEIGIPLKIIFTGGDALWLLSGLEVEYEVIPDLTLKGICYLFKVNRSTRFNHTETSNTQGPTLI